MARKDSKKSKDDQPSSSWSKKILEDLFAARGIEVDIKEDTNLAELLQRDRNQLYKLIFESKNEVQILCPPEKLVENINYAVISQYQNQNQDSPRFYAKREAVTMHPFLIFYFNAKWTKKNYVKSIAEATHRIRLTDFVCHPEDKNRGDIITVNDAKKIAARVVDVFAPNGVPFSFNKGFYAYTYKEIDIGTSITVHTSTESEATQLITKMLKVVGKDFDDKNFFESKVKNTARYTEKKSVVVMGQEFKQKATTKITGKVEFRSATLKLDKVGYERKLCQIQGRGPDSTILSYDEIG